MVTSGLRNVWEEEEMRRKRHELNRNKKKLNPFRPSEQIYSTLIPGSLSPPNMGAIVMGFIFLIFRIRLVDTGTLQMNPGTAQPNNGFTPLPLTHSSFFIYFVNYTLMTTQFLRCVTFTTCIIKIRIHSSCEIKYFVETHLCKLCVILRSRVLRVMCPH